MRVSVVGAGKMGLPIACQFASRGAQVTACDVNEEVVRAINAGTCPIDEPGIHELLGSVVRDGRLAATTDTAAAVGASDVIIVIVPAMLTSDRDIDPVHLLAASRAIAEGLRPGSMVIYETTMPVGGTRRLLAPALQAGGLEPGVDFDLVFSPERVKSQLVLRNLTVNPKVVGGVTPRATARAAAFYAEYLGAEVIEVDSLEAAEMVKLAGMVYRDVNIALANELGRYAEAVGVDLPSLLPAINSDGEAALLQPGIGVGGHCTPVYPHFLLRDADRREVDLAIPADARRINDSQVLHVLDQVEGLTGPLEGRAALILGLAFRPQVKEHAYSTAFALRDELGRRGAEVSLHDPLYTDDEIRAHGFHPGRLAGDLPPVLVLNTAHPQYRDLPFDELVSRGVRVVVDGRNAVAPDSVASAGAVYIGVGRPPRGGRSNGSPRVVDANPGTDAVETAAGIVAMA